MRYRHTDIRPLLLVGLALWPAAARAEDDPYAFFETHVRPVLVEHCYECHSGDTAKPKGGLRLDFKDAIRKGGASGTPAVVPGDAAASKLLEAIRYTNPDLQMPPKGKLPDAAIEALTVWINAGASDPRTEVPKPSATAVSKKDHWAFKPPVAAAPPAVRDAAWPRNDLDRFVLARLEAAGLAPAAAADRRTLILRAYFDLLGLPPDADAVDRFVNDPNPDAFAALVEDLLASPHYGERWGRHWLDVARYADTKGYVYPEREEAKFFHSHVYRDWVVRALNEDMPYDQFLKYQIAGDQITGPNGEDERAAMGFLTLGRRFLGVVHDIIDDRIDVVMRGTQGLSMGCARCHDHKFDPLSMHDYYGMYGVFSGSSERFARVPGAAESPDEAAAFAAEWDKRQQEFREEFTARKEALAALLRTQSDRYLEAALHASTFPSDEFYEIRGPDDLNPTIVWQWRRYLDRQADDDPLWGPWRQLEKTPAANFANEAARIVANLSPERFNPLVIAALRAQPLAAMRDVAAAYGAVLLRANTLWLETQQAADRHDAPDPARFDDHALEQVRAALYTAESPVEAPKGAMVDIEWYFDEPGRLALTKRSKAIETLLLKSPGAPAHALILEDKPRQRNPVVFKRGSAANKGEEVLRRFPEILGGRDDAPFASGSGRAEMAEAIAARSNPLTARVMVNRVWQWHFGEGLVRTPSDFGTRCEPPSHPELLDWLAVWFMDHGWRLKELHRLILNSAAWQQSGETPLLAQAQVSDPENRLLWRFNPQRLDFETLRDALLAASGTLSPEIGGKPVDLFKPPFPTRRTLYGNIDRTFLQGAYRVFDFPNPDMHGPQRSETSVPQQALFFMNSPFLKEQARALAKNIEGAPDDAARVAALYRRVFQQDPPAREVALARDFIAAAPVVDTTAEPEPEPSPWHYGYGAYDATAQRMGGFEPLPHFGDAAYQGGTAYPDAALGWLKLEATGGHPGNDLAHACVRRWTAPEDGEVTISGTINHEPQEGDGIHAMIVASNAGKLGEWNLHASAQDAAVAPVKVKAGDTLDFVVDIGGGLNSDQFLWAPIVAFSAAARPGAEQPAPRTYDAAKDFAPPVSQRPVPLTPWEQYAQVLLLSNRFAFVD
jgi:hypothetical protein